MGERTNSQKDKPLPTIPGVGNVLFDVWLLSRAVHALVDEAIGVTGLDADEYAIYSVLASGESITPTELSRWMAAPATTVSSYVEPTTCTDDFIRCTKPLTS